MQIIYPDRFARACALLVAITLVMSCTKQPQRHTTNGRTVVVGKNVIDSATRVAGTVTDEEIPDYELRGLFIATVYNIDWPSRNDLSPDEQRDEIDAIIQRAQDLNCNAIFLQVRGFGDCIYRSNLTPEADVLGPGQPPNPAIVFARRPRWSISLGATQQDPGYDPLALWIEKAHAAGIELHAWINPFRIDVPIGNGNPIDPVDPQNPPNNLPFFMAADNCLYLDYRDPRVVTYVSEVIDDLLSNYPAANVSAASGTGTLSAAAEDDGIDGVIIDHYFPDPPDDRTTQPATQRTAIPQVERRQKIYREYRVDRGADSVPAAIGRLRFFEAIYAKAEAAKVRLGLSPDWSDKQKELVKPLLAYIHYLAPEVFVREEKPFKDQVIEWVNLVNDNTPAGKPKPSVVPVLLTLRTQKPDMTREQLPNKKVIFKWHNRWDVKDIEKQVDYLQRTKRGQIHYSYSALRSRTQGSREEPIGEKLHGKLYNKKTLPPPVKRDPHDQKPYFDEQGLDYHLMIKNFPVRHWALRFLTADGWSDMKLRRRDENIITPGDIPKGTTKIRVWAINRLNERSSYEDQDLNSQ